MDPLAPTCDDGVTTTFRFKRDGVYVDDPRTPMTYDEWLAFCKQARDEDDRLAREEEAAFQAMIAATAHPICRYCRFAVLPGDPHPDCERDLREMAAHVYFADKLDAFADGLYVNDDEPHGPNIDADWSDDWDDDEYIDDDSLAEIRHGQRHEMY